MKSFQTVSVVLLLATGLAGAPQDRAASVWLRSRVAVTGGILKLSDLLPPDAGATLRAAAAEIDLGHTPQPGRLRVLEGEQVWRRLTGNRILWRDLSVPESITIERTGWPISRAAVEKAVASFLRSPEGTLDPLPDIAALQWDGEVRAAVPDAAVEVIAVRWDIRRNAFAVWLRCVEASFCGSFLVHVPRLRPDQAETLAHSPRLLPHSLAHLHPMSVAPSSHRGEPGVSLAQAGKPAQLIFDGEGFRISLPVVCLQRGTLGQKIQAMDFANHRIVWATVVGAGQLRAIF